jgi:hypothetical protein
VVELARDNAVNGISLASGRIEAEERRVKGLADAVVSLVHGRTEAQMATEYARRAKETREAAQLWTVAALVLGLLAIGWSFFIAVKVIHDNEDPSTGAIVAKALVSVSALVLAGYAAGIARNSRRMAWHWDHVTLQIQTAEPFIGNLDSETRQRVQAALALRLFPGQGQDPRFGGASQEAFDVGELVSAIFGQPPTKSPSTASPPSATTSQPSLSPPAGEHPSH